MLSPFEETQPTVKRCFFCDDLQYTRLAYIRLSQGRSDLLRKYVVYVFVKCFLCEDCYRRGNSVYYLRFLVLFGMIAFPAIMFCAGIPLISNVELSAGKGSTAHLLVTVGFLGLPWLSIPAGILYLSFAIRRRLRHLINPEATRYLLSLGVAMNWGLLTHLELYRKLPRGQTTVN
jgi:hypothetical protein